VIPNSEAEFGVGWEDVWRDGGTTHPHIPPSSIHPFGVHTRTEHAEFVCLSAAYGSVPDRAERYAPHREDPQAIDKTRKRKTPPVVEAGGVSCWIVLGLRRHVSIDTTRIYAETETESVKGRFDTVTAHD
jgi:hypothetical protein